jgi:Na+/H+-dicarboxylate symporter
LNVSLDRFSFGRALTIATLVALVLGCLAGTLAPDAPGGTLRVAAQVLEALGTAWIRALRMIVLPLVVSLLVVAVIGSRERTEVARMGSAAVGVFFALYLALAVLAALLYPPLVRLTGIARGSMSSLRIDAGTPPAVEPAAGIDVAGWLLQVLPANPFAAAAEENILQVVLFSILFAVAASRLSRTHREAVVALFSPVAEAMLVVVSWLLRLSPVAVFALGFVAAREIGMSAAWVLLSFALVTTVILLIATLGLIPVAGILGRVGMAGFARAAWPGQVVGFTTRSSLASLPALVEGSRRHLALPERVIGFGLPFAASTFKPNRLISSPGKLLFLSWVYAIPVDLLGYAMFIGYVMLISTTSVGVPNQGSRNSTVPAYLALGMPLEGVVLMNSVDMLWDYAATVLNSTGYLASTTLLPRRAAVGAVPAPVAAVMPVPVPVAIPDVSVPR